MIFKVNPRHILTLIFDYLYKKLQCTFVVLNHFLLPFINQLTGNNINYKEKTEIPEFKVTVLHCRIKRPFNPFKE